MARTRLKTLLLAGILSLLPAATGLAAEHDHSAMAASDEHAHHHEMMAAPDVQVSKHTYQLPATPLTDEQGASVSLQRTDGGPPGSDELHLYLLHNHLPGDDGHPVAIAEAVGRQQTDAPVRVDFG